MRRRSEVPVVKPGPCRLEQALSLDPSDELGGGIEKAHVGRFAGAMQAAARNARSGWREWALTPRLTPPTVTRGGVCGSTDGHLAQPMTAAISGAFRWADGQTNE